MSVFALTVAKVLNEYKVIVRKNLPSKEAKSKILALKISRKQIQYAQDIELYQKIKAVIADIQKYVVKKKDSVSLHSGIIDFMHYLQKIVTEYYIDEDRVIHRKQNASRAVLDAIQLITLNGEMNHAIANKLKKYIEVVAKYGTSDQCIVLHSLLEKSLMKNTLFFEPLLCRLRELTSQDHP